MTRPLSFHTTLVIAAAGLLLAAGCGRRENPISSGSDSFAASPGSSGKPDYSKPVLTEEKLNRLIASMQEQHHPLEFVFKPGGGMNSIADIKGNELQLNAYARRYGFKDYVEYIDTWGRVVVGQVQLGAARMFKGLAESTQQTIQEAEAKLKDPSLTPEERQVYTARIASSKESLAGMAQTDTRQLNAADLALVEKFNDRLNEASRKYRQR